MKKITREQMEQALTPKKWLKIDDVRINLANAFKTAKYATDSIIEAAEYRDLVPIVDLLLTVIRQSTDSLQESIEEWQNSQSYLD